MSVNLRPDSRGYIFNLISKMVDSGWALTAVPNHGQLALNRQPLVLHLDGYVREFLLHIYKVTGSSRNRPEERRIEITSAYLGGNPNRPTVGSYEDVVLGYDPEADVFVGFDHRRLFEGGKTSNASSFFDGSALSIPDDGLEVVPFESAKFGVEYHVYFSPSRAADYLLNARQIHQSGSVISTTAGYKGIRAVGGALTVANQSATGAEVHLAARSVNTTHRPVLRREVERQESGFRARSLSPSALDKVLARCQENGRLGEQHVLGSERQRLRGRGRPDLANRVSWVSLVNAAAGYDILVPEEDGLDHLVEVKSTQGSAMTFPMSEGEWRKAEQVGDRYWIARVTEVRSSDPQISWFRDPVAMEADGQLTRTWDGFRIVVEGYAT